MIIEIEKGLRAELVGDAGVTALVSTRVYNQQAPGGATYPYIVFSHQTGGDTNTTPTDEADVIYLVKGVSKSALEAQQIADAIRTALHKATLTLDDPWGALSGGCQHTNIVKFTENVEQSQIHHAGGLYRVRAEDTT